VAAGAAPEAVLAAAQARSTAQPAEITALQAELTRVAGELGALQTNGRRAAAEAFVDAAIREGRVGIKPVRERYVALHMADPAGTAALVAAMPALAGGRLAPPAAPAADGEVALQSEHLAAARLLGIDPKTYAATLKAERAHEEAL
jgi:hypothetical protein